MALSGTFKSSQVKDVGDYPSYVYVEWSATQNTGNNSSTISWKCYGGSYYNNAYRYTTTGPVVVTINGQTVLNKTGRFNMTQGMLLGSGTLTVQHNSNGEKSVPVSISAAIYYGSTSSTYSGTITLNTIPRISKIKAAKQTTIGTNCNIKWIPASKSFAYKLKFSLNGWSETTDYIKPSTTSEYTYTGYRIPTSLYTYLPNDPEGNMSVTLYTYSSASSGALIGTSDPKTFSVAVPDNIKPTIGEFTLTPDAVTLNGEQYNYLVKGVNKLTLAVKGAQAGTDSTIKSYTFSGPSISKIQASSTATIYAVNQSGLLPYTVVVTDARNRSTLPIEGKIECYDYSRPSVTLKISRSQDQITCTCTPVYSSINNKNSATIKIYVDGTVKETIKNVKNGEIQKAVITVDSADKSYEIHATITDALGNTEKSNSNNVYGKPRVMNITRSGTGVAFGKLAEYENCVDVPKLISRHNLVIKNNSRGLYIRNSSGVDEVAINRNTSDNLWIGAKNSTQGHITGGGTYISTGDNTNLYVSKLNNGTRTQYPVLDTQNYSAYIPMVPKVLYNNHSTGTLGNVPLSESASNYKYLEIFYYEANEYPAVKSVRYTKVSGSSYLEISSISDIPDGTGGYNSSKTYLRTTRYVVDSTNLTFKRSKCVTITNGNTPIVTQTESTTDNYFKIFRVIGYTSINK